MQYQMIIILHKRKENREGRAKYFTLLWALERSIINSTKSSFYSEYVQVYKLSHESHKSTLIYNNIVLMFNKANKHGHTLP